MEAEPVWIAFIVAMGTMIPAVVVPVVLRVIDNRNRRQEKEEDHARQEEVAEKAAQAARLLATNTAKVAETTRATNEKLDVIHVLVNSNMTAAMQAELDAVVRELAMMREVIELKRASGNEPGVDTLATIKVTEAKIAELRAALYGRAVQGAKAAAMAAQSVEFG